MMGTWWIWAVAALGLGIAEMLAPGFIFLGFALSAAALSLLVLVGGPLAAWLTGSVPLMMVVFAALALVAWIILRAVFGRPGSAPKTFEHDIND